MTADGVDLDSVATELYGLPPEEFTAARTAREKEARSAGNRALVAEIHRLGKPSTAAWLANQLVRDHRDQIGPLLELGELLRAASATLSGDQLRLLDRQQHQVIQALVAQAGRAAAAAGRRVSDETTRGLEDTLRAALADESAAEQVGSGRLTEVLRRSGFPATAVATPAAAPDETAASRSTARAKKPATTAARPVTDELAVRRRAAEIERAARAEIARAEDEEQAARAAADAAAQTRDAVAGAADTARVALADAAAAEDRLRRELAAATSEQERLQARLVDVSRELETAETAAREAAQRQTAAADRRRQVVDAHGRAASPHPPRT